MLNRGAVGSAVTIGRTFVGWVSDDRVLVDLAAQQSSACAWLMTRVALESCALDPDLCIGHAVPFSQHAIRASGVACHPSQKARFPVHSGKTATSAAKCLTNPFTLLSLLARVRSVKVAARLLHLLLSLPPLRPVLLHPTRHGLAGRCRHRSSPACGFCHDAADSASAVRKREFRERALDRNDLSPEPFQRERGTALREIA